MKEEINQMSTKIEEQGIQLAKCGRNLIAVAEAIQILIDVVERQEEEIAKLKEGLNE